jgi:myosin-1
MPNSHDFANLFFFFDFLLPDVNEKLQQIFIELTLKSEQEDYAREGVAWTPIPFFNNKIVCDLIEGTKPPGVFLIVDDVGATIHAQSEGTGGELVRKLQGVHAGHPHLACTSRGFTIRHYAGSVEYEGDSFVEANRDTLLPEILALAKSSRSKLVLHLFADDEDGPTTGRKQASLGSKMKVSDFFLSLMSYT